MAVNGALTVGTLLALAALLGRLYGPLTALSNVRVDVMTALVSFERVFEVLDLRAAGQGGGRAGRPPAPVRSRSSSTTSRFRYPSADEVSLASLESVASGDRRGGGEVLHDVDLPRSRRRSWSPSSARVAPARRPSPPSSPGSTTRPAAAVRIGGVDLRDVTWRRCTTSSAW